MLQRLYRHRYALTILLRGLIQLRIRGFVCYIIIMVRLKLCHLEAFEYNKIAIVGSGIEHSGCCGPVFEA